MYEPDGYGRQIRENGEVYIGEFKMGWRHGEGKCTYADGSEEEGRWEDNILKIKRIEK